MSTCNFHKNFASDYYVVDGRRYVNSEGEELEQWEEGCSIEDDTDFLLDVIVERASYEGWEKSYRRVGRDDFGLCEKWEDEDLMFGDLRFEIKIEINVCPGYYEACNLDWDIRIRIPGSGFDVRLSDYYSIEDLADDVFDAVCYYGNEGIKKMQKNNILKKTLDRISEVGFAADKFCRKNCTGIYGISAQFSNGETWYTKIA